MALTDVEKYHKFCSNRTCATCESCIYDEGYVEDLKEINKNNMEKEEIKFAFDSCNECPHAIKEDVKTQYNTFKYVNWFCGKTVAPYSTNTGTPSQRSIEMSCVDTKKINSPYWCPFKGKMVKTAIGEATTVTEPKPFKDLPYMERREKWLKVKVLSTWETIKENEIYHIPPINGEERKDILVTYKSSYSLSYRNLNKPNSLVETMYPSSLNVNFFVKHKIKEFKLADKK